MPVISKGGLQLAGRSILTRPRTSHFMGPSSTIQDPKPCVGLPVERVPPRPGHLPGLLVLLPCTSYYFPTRTSAPKDGAPPGHGARHPAGAPEMHLKPDSMNCTKRGWRQEGRGVP